MINQIIVLALLFNPSTAIVKISELPHVLHILGSLHINVVGDEMPHSSKNMLYLVT